MVTIRDVAKKAGVGLGTVSRVLNNSPRVSEETRQHVLQAIEELNYTPSSIARRLSLGKTYTVGAVLPFLTSPSAVERLRGVEATLAHTPYDLIIFNVETEERRDACIKDVLRKARVDGLIVISLRPTDEEIDAIAEAKIPVVLVEARHPSLSHIVPDDVTGGSMATEHLVSLGHERIAFVGDVVPTTFEFTSSSDRHRGYREALEAAGIPYYEDYYKCASHGRYEAQRMTREVLALPDPPTAVFAASDVQALGVLEAARETGIRVPDELSIIGYDDVEIAEYLGLTTIRQFLFESGQQGVELLLEALEEPYDPIVKLLTPELVIRGTTAAPNELAERAHCSSS